MIAVGGSWLITLWIDASSPVSVAQSYRAIASQITEVTLDHKSDQAVVSVVKDILRGWKRPWLVVFDNYDDPLAFQNKPINKYIPEGRKRSVLFTSRHGHSERLGKSIEVSEMTQKESLDLLLRPPL